MKRKQLPKGPCRHDNRTRGLKNEKKSNFQLPKGPCGHDNRNKGLAKFKKSNSQLPKGPCGHDTRNKGLEQLKKSNFQLPKGPCRHDTRSDFIRLQAVRRVPFSNLEFSQGSLEIKRKMKGYFFCGLDEGL